MKNYSAMGWLSPMKSFSLLVGKVASDPRELDVMPIAFFSTNGACLKPENTVEDAEKM